MTGQLTVLGSCGGWPEAGRACSGFLLEYRATRIVLDLGYGAFSRLQVALGSPIAAGLTAVIITHAHPDHVVDGHALMRARAFTRHGEDRVALHAPPEAVAMLAALDGGDDAYLARVFDVHPLPGRPSRIGPFTLESWTLPHYVRNVGVRLSAPGLIVAYTGDTGPDPALAALGREADLFIVDCTDREQQADALPAPPGPALDLTSHEAAAAGVAAGARRLLLTHFWPGNDRDLARTQAQAIFPGEVLIADESLRISLP